MSGPHESNVLTTYRTLRVAMIPLLLTLLVATGLETAREDVCVLGSISAYFHTPVRGSFVFALAALGACLIAYKGNDPVEDVLLNFAGFMAFLVALVPTEVDSICGPKYLMASDTTTADAIRNNVVTLIAVSVIAAVLYWGMPVLVARARKRRKSSAPTSPSPVADGRKPRSAKLPRILAVAALVIAGGELSLFVFLPDMFADVAHGISAVTMVVGVLGVMGANAVGYARVTQDGNPGTARTWVNRYAVTAGATFAALVVTLVLIRLTPWTPYLILVLEVLVILGFAVFWLMQTRELWDYPTRAEKSQSVEQLLSQPTAPLLRPSLEPAGSPGPMDGGAAVALKPVEAAPAEETTKRADVYNSL